MSGLKYVKEHVNCFRYEQDAHPVCDIVHRSVGDKWGDTLSLGEIIIVRRGAISISYDEILNHRVVRNKMILLPPGCHFHAEVEEECMLFIFRMIDSPRLCESYPVERLNEELNDTLSGDNVHTPDVCKPIGDFLDALAYNMDNGLLCSLYLRGKAEELMLLLRAYYTKEDLAQFFRPVLMNSNRFTNFVLQNYRRVKTVKELASLYACSLSNFDKKFRKAFGMAPYQWIQERRVNLIYHELYVSDKPIKQIAEEQGFNSLPQFNDYCKKHFGYPPGKMRKIAPSMMNMKT